MSKQWWWIALTDESKPNGQQAVGAVVVQAADVEEADRAAKNRIIDVCRAAGINPNTALTWMRSGGPMDPKYGNPPERPPGWGHVMTKSQAEDLAREWCGGVASPDQIKAAFLDDEAKPGDPLFKRKP